MPTIDDVAAAALLAAIAGEAPYPFHGAPPELVVRVSPREAPPRGS